MNLSEPDYLKLYKVQDHVIQALKEELKGFYLTGGTALGRFYLDHRYSEDLDFFTNADTDFASKVNRIYRKLKTDFTVDEGPSLITDSYARIYLKGNDNLKIDLVNNVPERWGPLNDFEGTWIDNPANILSNKLGALMSRDEPKDVFDIVSIASSYSFSWKEVFHQAGRKQLIDETDLGIRLSTFPVALMTNQLWLKAEIYLPDFSAKLVIISDDFRFARDNTLGVNRPNLESSKISRHF